MSRIRVLTANLANGRADPDRFAALLEEWAPDAVALQELAPEQAEAVGRLLGHGCLEPGRDHCGMGIALRRPGSVDRVELPGRPARRALLAPPDWPGLDRPIEILNVHFCAPHAGPPWRVLPTRRKQVRGIERYLATAPPRPRALVGDLNATPLWPAYRRLRRFLADAALLGRGTTAAPSPPRTWAPWPGGPRLLRIDHLLVSRLEVEALRRIRVAGSDHDALLADLVLARGVGAERGA